MGCLRGSKFTCILSCPGRKTGFPEISCDCAGPGMRDVASAFSIGAEISHSATLRTRPAFHGVTKPHCAQTLTTADLSSSKIG